MRLAVTFMVALAFMIPVAGSADAPADAAEAGIHLVHDLGADGTAWVGQPYSFGYVLLDADGMTRVHQQGCIVVEQNGVVLYETTADSSHDYNALNTFQFTFERAGPFTVWVAIPDGACGEGVQFEDQLQGVAKRAPGGVATADATIDVPDQPPADAIARIQVGAIGANETRWDNTSALVEIRRPGDEWLALRAPLTDATDGEGGMTACYRFSHPGAWLVRAIVEDTADPPRFAPTAAVATVEVSTSPMTALTNPEDYCETTSQGCVAPQVNAAADEGRHRLRTTIDPQASSSQFSRFVLNALVYNAEADGSLIRSSPASDVAFDVKVQSMTQDCNQFLFATSNLDGATGVTDLSMHWPDPGQYAFQVEAALGEWTDAATLLFTVGEVLPVHGIPMPGTAGAVIVTADGLNGFVAGEPGTVTFSAADPTGRAAAHSEIDFQVLRDPWGPPLVQNKLHTHASGSFEFGYTFAEAGDYLLVVDPVTIHGEATPDYYYGQLGGDLVVPFTVGEGPGLVDTVTDDPDDQETGGDPAIPSVGVLGAVAAVAVGLVLRRCR